MASKHNAEYFAQRRRAQGLVAREDTYLYLPRIVQQGQELALMMQELPELPWPHNLYTSAWRPLQQQHGVRAEDLCQCNCKKRHNQNVTQTVPSPYGRGWHILYFYSEACKSRYNRERAAQ